ncbi:MAG: hypothetical protein LUQ07_00170 [Methanospirillum sp.]|nr:hypothetical protein [Methanospirillum sp.]
MAEYLLKGGKMLSKTCPVCHSPLFEYKGGTICVVCREDEKPPETSGNTVTAGTKPVKSLKTAAAPGGLEDEFTLTLGVLLTQAREEHDGNRQLQLMNAVKAGAEAYALLLYGYGRRDNS